MSSPESVLPSNDRLLSGIKSALQRIAQRTTDDHTKSELGAIDVIVGELMLRHQSGFYVGFYADLLALIEEGRTLLGARLSADASAKIQTVVANLPATLAPSLDAGVIGVHTNAALRCLEILVEAGRGDVPAPIQDYVSRIVAKENEYQAHRIPTAVPPAVVQPAYTAFTLETMQAYMRNKFPQRTGLRVTQFKQLVGGYQKITALFDVEDDSGACDAMVLRAEKDDRFLKLDAGNVVDEYAIVRVAFEAGLSVPEPLWLEADKSKMGYCFFVSRKAPGTNYGSAISAEKSIPDDVARSFIQTMARIHQTPISDALRRTAIGHWMDHPTLYANSLANVYYWKDQKWMEQANPSPLFTRLTTWLIDNVPHDEDTPRWVHGDFGPHNVLVHEGTVSGVLDWEASYIGDQAEDLAWFLQGCAGQITDAKALAWYQEFTGWKISEFRLRYYDVFNCLKILTGAMSVGPMFETLENSSIEWCNIPLRWAPFSTGLVEGKIKAAEAVKRN